jgi:hypothetical protein
MIFFNKKPKSTHVEGNIYVVDAGTYGGEYLVLIEDLVKSYSFLVLPEKQKRVIEVEVFTRGINNKVVTFLEKLPKHVFKVCKTEYEKINIIV